MRLVLNFKDGHEEMVDAESGKLDFRTLRNADTISYWDERAIYLDDLTSVEISGHPEYVPEKPLPTKQIEQSPADFWMGKSNAHFGTPEAQARKTTLTIRKGTK